MKRVWLIALWMVLVIIPTSVFSDSVFDPRHSVQGDARLMEAIRAGRMHRQCALHCRGYFHKQCNRCIERGIQCALLNMDDCKLCMEDKKACRAYMEGVTELLDELDADVNYPAGCWRGDTPLIEAIKVDSYMYKVKTKAIAKKTGELKDSYNFVFRPNDEKRKAVICALLNRDADPNITSCFYGVGALMEAVMIGDESTAKMILEAGADPDGNICRRHEGMKDHCFRLNKTPLMEAARKGDLPMVTLLVESDADLFLYDKDSQTALRYADKNHHEDVKKYLQWKMSLSQPN